MANDGLGSWLERRRVTSRGVAAIRFGGVDTTYDELAGRADRLAGVLTDAGIARDDRVAYLGDNHPSFLEWFFAAATIGAVFVPLNTRLAHEELAYMLTDSGARMLVATAARREAAERAARIAGVATVVGSEIGAVAAGGGGADGVAQPGHPEIGADEPAVILYTSGTTGHPKGAVLTHGNLTWSALNVIVDYDVASTDRALMVSPLFHAASLGMGALPALLKGSTIVLEERFDAGRALSLIASERITTMSGVPTTFQLLCEHPDWERTDLSSLRRLTCGGSAIPLHVIEAFERRGLSFTGGYGMTEAGPGVTSLSAAHSARKIGSGGLPHFFTDIRLVAEDGRMAEPGEIAEIQVRGPNLTSAYWGLPDATAAAFADGWFHTGDLGYRDGEGFLYVTGRAKDMIISGGENIYPIEVERILDDHPAIAGSALIGVADEQWGEVPLAVLELRPGAAVTLDDVRAALEGHVARYKMPKGVVVVAALPRTASGKVRKADLRASFPTLPHA